MVYLFDSYELDEENLRLTRAGSHVPLEPRALAVLLLMAKSDGKLLRKEAIFEAVWKNTVVEESTLSRVIAMLRKHLGDDPRNATFIETVPTFGYRFIPPVTLKSSPAPVAPSPVRSAQAYRLTGAGLLALAVISVLWWMQSARPPAAQKKTIVLAEFINTTGETVFDDTLRQGMIVQLEQSPALVLLPDRRIQAALRLMGKDPSARLTPELGREVCQRTGSLAVLEGSIAGLGGQYVIGLRALNCGTGDVIDTEQVQASNQGDVLRALDQIASKFRTRLGESMDSISSLDTPLEEATTPSLDALKAFSEANRVANSTGSAAAISLLETATALDPEFAIAHAMLGRMYGDIGQESRSASSTAEAYKFRSRASEREKFFIEASYDLQVTGNLVKAEETCETWARVYPRDDGPWGFPTGVILRVFGQYDEAVERGKRLVALDPYFAMAYHLLAVNQIALGRLDEAQALLDAAAARRLEIPFYALDRYRLAFLKGDKAGAERLAALAARQPATQDLISAQDAFSLAYAGRLYESRIASRHAVGLAVQAGRPELAARFEAGAALVESFLGNAGEAAARAAAALELSKGRDAEYGAAMAFALAQNSALAAGLADDLEHRFPEDTAARFLYVPTIRAVLSLKEGDPEKAIELLQVTSSYELGTPQSSFLGLYGALYPAFIRGQAYLALHRGPLAATEFQKIVDHRSLTVGDPIGALSYLELGRSWLESNDKIRAKAAYAEFLALWKDADHDSPTLTAANGEYSKL